MNYTVDYDKKKKKAEWPAFINISEWKQEHPVIYLIPERCKACSFCINYCPEQILEFSSDINQKGYHLPKLKEGKDFSNCAECHFCELICPEFAIFVKVPEKQDEEEKPSE
ncbi:MAG: 4Fe-4S dicluster domain-containing protein [Candidatus Heimdallarchaeaceae archaeon]